MVYVLATRPRLIYIGNRYVQGSRRLISGSTGRLFRTSTSASMSASASRCAASGSGASGSSALAKNKLFRKRNVALVTGIIIIGSYISFNNSYYYNLDTVSPPITTSPPANVGKTPGMLPLASQQIEISPTLSSSSSSSSSASTIVATPIPKPAEAPVPTPAPAATASSAGTPSSSSGEFGNDKKYYSTSTNSMKQNSIGSHQHKEGVFLLNEEQVSHKLRQYEESYLVNRGKGVTRYDTCQLPLNSPIEDDRAEEIVQVPIIKDNNVKTSTDWMFFGIFDGHGGWTTSSKLRDQLISYVIREFGTIFKVANKDENLRYVPISATIDQAIKNGFLRLDHELVNKNIEKLLNDNNKAKAAELLMPALSGSCALLSFYDTNSKLLRVAVTGDSRALLGSFKENHWTVKQLSIDQTGSNPTEVARIISEHPDEPNVIRNGRVLGTLEPSRAFGDCRYKLPASIQERIYKQFFGRRLPNNLKSPPYVTAEPVVTTTKINPENNDFLVMASDGLYEMLSNEEIIGLVVKWMEKEKMIKPQKSFWNNIFGSNENKLPEVADITNDKTSSKQPFRKLRHNTGNYGSFLLEDKNVSTHLIRNALSNGGSREQTSMLISIPSPVSRRYRDDLSVTVVFFGQDINGENDTGKLDINPIATAGGQTGAKPKL